MFQTTIVHCSYPGCDKPATTKIASPWAYRRFAELKTFGFACPAHVEAVLDAAHDRSEYVMLAEGESAGALSTYDLEA